MKTTVTFRSNRIVIEDYTYQGQQEFQYGIYNHAWPVKDEWVCTHSDDGFKTVEEARKAAEHYIDNWDSNDDMFAQ